MDLANGMLGTLFLTLGLAASAATTLRASRRDRALLWFGAFTALYGLRLIVRSHAIQGILPMSAATSRTLGDLITYVILVPGALLASAALAEGPKSPLRLVWRVNLACALIAIAWDIAAGRTGAAMGFNRAVVVVNLLIAVARVASDLRLKRLTHDAWVVLGAAAVFAAVAVIETVHNGPFGHVDPEPLAMLVVVIRLGYVVVKHVFHSERRMAAVGRELETARQIQQSILPKHPPTVPGLSVATHYDSMAEVAGDLFDFVITPSGQLGVLVADVSGHGVPAAIVASMVKIALAVQEGEISDPGLVLTRMNRALCGRFELAYVTAVFALIDPAAGTLTYASAGHPSPLAAPRRRRARVARRARHRPRLSAGCGLHLGRGPATSPPGIASCSTPTASPRRPVRTASSSAIGNSSSCWPAGRRSRPGRSWPRWWMPPAGGPAWISTTT